MVHIIAMNQKITTEKTALVYWNAVGKLHGIPQSVVSDSDPRFVFRFSQELWGLLWTELHMPSAHH